MSYVDIVFDGPPGPEGPRFVEAENANGASISIGEWLQRDDGYWVLRIPQEEFQVYAVKATKELFQALQTRVNEVLTNAVSNDYDLSGWEAIELATDVAEYAPEFEEIDPRLIAPFIADWQGQIENQGGVGKGEEE